MNYFIVKALFKNIYISYRCSKMQESQPVYLSPRIFILCCQHVLNPSHLGQISSPNIVFHFLFNSALTTPLPLLYHSSSSANPLQVLATGLSALYSSLPRKIEVRGDDWHALRREDWMGVSSLVLFMNSLEFCNAVIQVAHPLVRSQLVDYVHNGFLVPVMGPALHKVGGRRHLA